MLCTIRPGIGHIWSEMQKIVTTKPYPRSLSLMEGCKVSTIPLATMEGTRLGWSTGTNIQATQEVETKKEYLEYTN